MKKRFAEPLTAEITAWLQRFARAYSRKDLAAVMALFEPKQSLRVLGSGPDEASFTHKKVEKRIRRDFAQSGRVAMRFDWIKTDIEGHVAWFVSEVTLTLSANRQKQVYPYRFTGVLVRRDGEWRLRMGHLGQIASSQAVGQSWPSA